MRSVQLVAETKGLPAAWGKQRATADAKNQDHGKPKGRDPAPQER